MSGSVSALDGSFFVVSDAAGDIDSYAQDMAGLFAMDTRFLSRWVLTINEERTRSLSVDEVRYFEKRFFLTAGETSEPPTVSVVRQRTIGGTLFEMLTVANYGPEPVDLVIRLEAAADFADQSEARRGFWRERPTISEAESGRLRLAYRRGQHFHRETLIYSSQPADFDECGLTYLIHLDPGQSWATGIHIAVFVRPSPALGLNVSLQDHARWTWRRMDDELAQWMAQAPTIRCSRDAVRRTYQRSLVDLASLRFAPLISSGELIPAAGLPSSMTLFGRDTIITCLQTLPFLPSVTTTALRVLALAQGCKLDDFRDEEPGKILHEVRYGESAGFEEQPHTSYFGAADTTPLFLILLDEYERWTKDGDLVRQLEYEARLALTWIDTYADIMGNGYVWYYSRNRQTGLENHGWKNSRDAISYADGRLPRPPLATCELQGYAYDAKLRAARLARTFWNDTAYAQRLESEAAELKRRFNEDFWIADRGYYALALDRDGHQVDALASNMGHLLWSGVVDQNRSQHVVDHLLGSDLFSGWGVRTLGTRQRRYNPVDYHSGAVWPFDTSLIAWGLSRYGHHLEASLLARAMFDAAAHFDGRLPQALAGYDRELTRQPVPYPGACSPHATSAGTPLLLLRVLLGLDPDHERPPVPLPRQLGRIELRGVLGPWGRKDFVGRSARHHQPSD